MVTIGENIGNIGLPSDAVVIELVNLFFEHWYHAFPCFHKTTFLQQVQSRSVHFEAPSLLYAMCAIAAINHPEQSVRDQHMNWHEMAKFEYEMTGKDPQPAIRIVQTALLILRHASSIGDYSSGWLFIGKAWRQACALGLNRVDSDDEAFYGISYPRPKRPVEKEEYRRTLWLLFMTDRSLSWPTGWPQSIDDRQFKVNVPVADNVFQVMTLETETANSRTIPFVRNLNSLLATSSLATSPLNMFHYVIIAHVLLGRVTEQIHSLHDTPDSPNYAQECNDLSAHLVKFRLSLPRATTSVLEALPENRGYVLWLNVTINTMAILLHYRCAKLVDEAEAHQQFMRAVAAARNAAQMVKDTSLISTDLLLSAHLGSSLYISACVLVIQWKLCGDESLKADIDLFCLVFERFREKYAKLGHKFKSALDYDLKRSTESISDLRERGFRGLLADCSKWRAVMGTRSEQDLGY
ncbi:hypothetical protein K491DRAFT_603079 [Lophiostoma macrostomum CBS 122681]|uniref:Xylanolytic transcriptional activator regulatory domain-containing protein n=1 Tax=Lophiostoma macrostomum CBS 122681 TaxID=1314788 RepID=A0A6A6T3G1_9PLEO|nr:hypothetical protein K491DRAFT_603079 [Lophiostoma macrostomum CBS 122681]